MFTIFILCRIYVKGASKQSSDLKNYTVLGPRPPVLKFLDPPLWVLKYKVKVKMICLGMD